MKLKQVTITGADDSTHVGNMLSLEQKYPFVEWGILFSYTKAGTPKYPKHDNLGRFFHLHTSAHLCGGFAREVFERGNWSVMSKINLLGFDRIQLNYNFSAHTDWSLHALPKFHEVHPEVPIILQYNQSNMSVVHDLILTEPRPQLHILFDSSGGRGLNTARVQAPFNLYTGYSGGLGPGNIEEFVEEIVAFDDPSEVWIDMETYVRTGDELDLEKVEKVLEICSKYITI
jgi:hypothetical protein